MGCPLRVDQRVRGSSPTCSDVVPAVVVLALTGNVTGIVVEQVLPLAVRVKPVIWVPSAEYI